MIYYILKDKEAIPVDDVMEWATSYEDTDNRKIGEDRIRGKYISTVFLGLDHSFGDGPPLLFETMVFPDEQDNWREEEGYRYSTYEEAEAGHKEVVNRIRDDQ